MHKLSYTEFNMLAQKARCQFVARTKKGLFFMNVPHYTSYNEKGFVARSEESGQFDILLFEDVLELIIDSKKVSYQA